MPPLAIMPIAPVVVGPGPGARPGPIARTVGALLVVILTTAAPFAARHVVLPGAEVPMKIGFIGPPPPPDALVAFEVLDACRVWSFRTAYGVGLETYVRALGIASALALVGSAVRGRKLRSAGAALLALALAGVLATAVVTWPLHLGPRLIALSLGATLAHVGLGLAVARWCGVSAIGLAFVLERAITWVALFVGFSRSDPAPIDLELAAYLLMALAVVAPFAAGVWLVRRYRLASCDLSGALSVCAAPAEVALLPVAWSLVGLLVVGKSRAWTHEVAPGGAAWLDTQVGVATMALLLAAASIAALALILRARERRDRRLVGA